MDPFELMCRRPTPVKSSSTNNDFDFDEGLIDRVLGKPNKIDIPERYIPEREHLPPEEEEKRSQKAEAICRLLTKSNSSAGPLLLVLPHPNRHSYHQQQHQHPQHHQYQHPQHHQYQQPQHHQYQHQHQHQNQNHHNNISYGSSKSLQSGVSASASLGVNSHLQGLPVSPGRRPLSSSLKKASSSSRLNNRTPTRNASTCDWSLAGVSAPTSPHPSSNLSRNSYYSSNSASSLYTPSPCPVVNTKPSHSYHSSYSSTSSGRSSSDREDLLHLQHNIAREVTEKSRLVAVRALASSPCATPLRFNSGNRYREPSPPSPIDLPTIQQPLFLMHTDLSPHLHREECNELIRALQVCHEQNRFIKFFGVCNDINSAMLRCLKSERLEKRRINFESSGAKKMLEREAARKKSAESSA